MIGLANSLLPVSAGAIRLTDLCYLTNRYVSHLLQADATDSIPAPYGGYAAPVRLVIYVHGPTSVGKTTFSRCLTQLIQTDGRKALHVPCDSFKSMSRAKRIAHKLHMFDPRTFDLEKQFEFMQSLLTEGKSCEMPTYDQREGKPGEPVHTDPAEVVIVEGVSSMYGSLLRFFPGLVIFFDATAALQEDLWIAAGMARNSYTPEEALAECAKNPEYFAKYIAPFKQDAHIRISVDLDHKYQVELAPAQFLHLEIAQDRGRALPFAYSLQG